MTLAGLAHLGIDLLIWQRHHNVQWDGMWSWLYSICAEAFNEYMTSYRIHTHTRRAFFEYAWTSNEHYTNKQRIIFFSPFFLLQMEKWMSHKAIADLEMNLHYNLFSCVKCDSHTHPKAIIVCRNDKMRFSYAKAIFSAPITSKHIWQWGSTLWGRIMTIHFNKNEKV